MPPIKSVLLPGTQPRYEQAVADGSNIKPGLLVYMTGTVANGMTLAGQFHGDAQITERSLYIVEVLPHRFDATVEYDLTTAVTAGKDLTVHALRPGDRIWAYLADPNAIVTNDQLLLCAANGTIATHAVATTVDKYDGHAFRLISSIADPGAATWVKVEYIGLVSFDAS